MTGDDTEVTVEVEVLVTAEVPTPMGYVFRAEGNRLRHLAAGLRPGGATILSPCLAYVVRHPTAGTILVDTGLHPDAAMDLRRDFGLPMSLLFRALRPADQPFADQLRSRDVAPESVRRVVMTHLHVDHTSGMRQLPNARFACSRAEWAATKARLAAGQGYVAHHLPAEARMELVDFEADGVPFGPFALTTDLLGDGSVRLIFTPGHTAGHLSVLLKLAGPRFALLVGDAAYTLRSIDDELLPMITADDAASRRSLRALKRFADADSEAILVPTHDPEAWQALRR